MHLIFALVPCFYPMFQEVLKKLIIIKSSYAKTLLVVGIWENSVIRSDHIKSMPGMTLL